MKDKLRQLLSLSESKYSTAQMMHWLWIIWRGNRLQALLNILIDVASVGLSLLQVWAVKHAIDVAAGSVEGNLYWAVAVMGIIALASFALHIASTWVKVIIGIKAQNRIQQTLLERFLQTEWRGKEKYHSGDIINRLKGDVNSVVTVFTETIPGMISTFTLFAGAAVYLFALDARLALVIICITPLFLIFSKIYVRRMRKLTRRVLDSDSRVQSVLQETVQHRMLIKTLESNDEMVQRLETSQSELRQNIAKRTVFSTFSNITVSLGFTVGYLIAFLWSALRMSAGTLTFGGMTAFLQLVNRIQGPLRTLMRIIPIFVGVFTAAERLMELEDNPLEQKGEPHRFPNRCGLRVENVDYAYDDGNRNIIEGLSFDFKPGTCTAILGHTGAGKTTLIRLLLALIHPQKGRVVIYDDEGHEELLSPLTRCNIVYVPQGNTLMSGTIRDNLLLGKLDATEEEMYDALHRSCADFVEQLPDKLDTQCAEAGGGLSEGQAQRIAIARALLRDRQVMLFDEATSALDPQTEQQLLSNILSTKTKTIIFITHREAVTAYCDQQLRIYRTLPHAPAESE